VGVAEARELDQLAVLPQLVPTHWLIDAAMASLSRTGLVMGRVWRIADPRSKVGGSVGAFSLFRRSALERSPGLEHLRLEVIDDLALGQMLKDSGARSAVVNGRGCVLLQYHRSFADMARSSEKAAALFDYRLTPGLAWALSLTALELGSLAAALFAPTPLARNLGAVGAVLLLGSTEAMCCFAGQRLSAAILSPLGVLLNAALLIRAAWLARVRGGLLWRSTLYSPELLRPGRRVKAPWAGSPLALPRRSRASSPIGGIRMNGAGESGAAASNGTPPSSARRARWARRMLGVVAPDRATGSGGSRGALMS